MRGVYTLSHKSSAHSTAVSLIYVVCPATCAIEILSAGITNATTETNEQWEVAIAHVTSIGTPQGTALTPIKAEKGDAASLITGALGDLTTEPTTATEFVDNQGVPSLGGYRYEPVPEERITVGPSKALVMKFVATMTSTDVVAWIKFREIA